MKQPAVQEQGRQQTPLLPLLDQWREIAAGTDQQIGRDLHRVHGDRREQQEDRRIDDNQPTGDIGPLDTGEQQINESIVIQDGGAASTGNGADYTQGADITSCPSRPQHRTGS